MKYRHSRVVFSIYGLNFSRIINSFSSQGIRLYKIRKDERVLSLEVDLENERRVKDYLDECCVRYEIKRIKGEKRLFDIISNRPFLPIFAIVFIGLFCFMLNFVFEVELSGIERVAMEDIEMILEEYALTKPILKWNIDTKEINKRISEVEGVALSSVYIRGCVLYVEIEEELDKGIIDDEEFTPIRAKYDCIITSIYVERGFPMVTVGQTVKKGDILIDAYFMIDKESGARLPCAPKGEVKGRVFYEEEEEYYPRQIQEYRSGNYELDRVVSILGREIIKEIPSKLEEYEEERSYITLYPLGITLCTIKRYELKKKEIIIPFEQIKEEKIEEIYSKLDCYVKNNVVINNKWCIIRDNGESVTIKAYLETEEKVH